jgi:hypothetical protein
MWCHWFPILQIYPNNRSWVLGIERGGSSAALSGPIDLVGFDGSPGPRQGAPMGAEGARLGAICSCFFSLDDKGRCRLSRRCVDGPVVFGKMAFEVAAIVEDTGHFNNAVFAAAIEKEMSRILHPWTAHAGSAQRKVVSPRAPDHDLGSLSRFALSILDDWTLGIGSDVL